jgi:hypothetical protein
MGAQAEFRQALENGDVAALQRIHPILFPHAPAAPTSGDAEIQMHMARTQADWLDLKRRAYSHRWLQERGYPSQLPDDLKPKAERLYPIIAEAVLVSANSNSPILKPAMPIVQKAMCDAVEEAAADGKLSDSEFVKARMGEARRRSMRQLFGRERMI